MVSPELPFRLILVRRGESVGKELEFTSDDQAHAVAIAEGYLLMSTEQEEIHLNDQRGRWFGTVAPPYRSPWL